MGHSIMEVEDFHEEKENGPQIGVDGQIITGELVMMAVLYIQGGKGVNSKL